MYSNAEIFVFFMVWILITIFILFFAELLIRCFIWARRKMYCWNQVRKNRKYRGGYIGLVGKEIK